MGSNGAQCRRHTGIIPCAGVSGLLLSGGHERVVAVPPNGAMQLTVHVPPALRLLAQSLVSMFGVSSSTTHGRIRTQSGTRPTGCVIPGLALREQRKVSEPPTNPEWHVTSHASPSSKLLQPLTSIPYPSTRGAHTARHIGAVPDGSAVGSMLSAGHANSASSSPPSAM